MVFRLHNPVHPVHRCFISSIHDLPRVKRQSQGLSEGIDRQSTIHQSVPSWPFVVLRAPSWISFFPSLLVGLKPSLARSHSLADVYMHGLQHRGAASVGGGEGGAVLEPAVAPGQIQGGSRILEVVAVPPGPVQAASARADSDAALRSCNWTPVPWGVAASQRRRLACLPSGR